MQPVFKEVDGIVLSCKLQLSMSKSNISFLIINVRTCRLHYMARRAYVKRLIS